MSRPAPPALTVRNDGSAPHLRRWQRCRHRSRSSRRRPHRTPTDLPGTPGAAVRPGPVDRHRQRQPERDVRQRPPGADRRHPRRPEHQHRQPGRSAADVRGRPGTRPVGRPPTTSIPVTGRPSGSWPSQQPPTQPTAGLPPAAVPNRSAALPIAPSSRATRARPQPSYAGSQPQPTRPPSVASQQAAQPLSQPALESVTAIGPTAAPRSSEGNLATSMLKILRPRSARRTPRAGLDQDRPRHRQRHRHPRRAGVASPRDAGADRRGHRDPRQPQHQRHVRQRHARRERPAARGRRRHDRQRRPGVPRRHAGPPHRDRPRPPAPAAWRCTASPGPSRATRRCCDNISLTARPGTLTAVIGPSGAGKSTFARLVAGYTHPTEGTVAFEGHDIHAEYASLRSRIGMVPQDDVVHGQLTVNQALMLRGRTAAAARTPTRKTANRSSRRCSRNSR